MRRILEVIINFVFILLPLLIMAAIIIFLETGKPALKNEG